MSAEEAAAAKTTEKKVKGKKEEKPAPAEEKPAVEAKPVVVIPPFMGVSNRKGCGVTVKSVAADEFIAAYAKHLKASGKIIPPAWAEYCKTGSGKELSPINPDWYYIRAASIARHIYLRPCGVQNLRIVYGGLKSNGVRPDRRALAAGGVIRRILIQLEAMQIVEKCPEGKKISGRRITAQGRRELDNIAKQVIRETKNRPIRV